jgi:prevent-host-death family protein
MTTFSAGTAPAKEERQTTISATDFKARCLSILDDMEQSGEPIIITRRGLPVAVLGPAPKDAWKSPADSWKDKAEILGDIINSDVIWEAASAS